MNLDKILNELNLDTERIRYVKVSKEYIEDYLKMVNNPIVSQYIALKDRTFI